MNEYQQELEELKQRFRDKFPEPKLESLSQLQLTKYTELKPADPVQRIRFNATLEDMKPIDRLVIQALASGEELKGSELYSKLEGYSTGQRLESLLFLVDQGVIVKNPAGFKLTMPTPLHQIEESLKDALSKLEQVRNLMQSSQLDQKYSHLFKCITDSVQATSEAIAHISDAPDN